MFIESPERIRPLLQIAGFACHLSRAIPGANPIVPIVKPRHVIRGCTTVRSHMNEGVLSLSVDYCLLCCSSERMDYALRSFVIVAGSLLTTVFITPNPPSSVLIPPSH